MYTAYCPELGVASCGKVFRKREKNLLEVIEIQLEETEKLETLKVFCIGSETVFTSLGKHRITQTIS